MEQTSYEHEVRGDGKKAYLHTALLKSDFEMSYRSDLPWEVLSGIADKIPASERDWAAISGSTREIANLDYAVNLGILEAMSDLRLTIQRVEGSKDQYEFFVSYHDMGDGVVNVERHLPMHFATIKAPSDTQGIEAMEIQEETDEHIIIKITKDKNFP